MAKALVCDNCGDKLIVNERGDDEAGESVAWLQVGNSQYSWDACTRGCAHTLIDGPVREVVDAHTEVVAEIARTIREEREREAGDV